MSRLAKKSPPVCVDLPLDDSDFRRKLKCLRQLLESCFGPAGRLKQVHNNIGGHVITTSTSSVLLQSASSSHPLMKIITASVLGHVSRFSDCGLFVAIFCLALIDRANKSGLCQSTAIRVNQHLLSTCTGYLHQEDCGCKLKLDFCGSQNLIGLSRSVICSKPACVLTELEAMHISRLAVQAFVMTVPCEGPGRVSLGRVVTVSVEGLPVKDSSVFPGLLVEIPEILYPGIIENDSSAPLKMVLYTASLSGDLFELGDGSLEVNAHVDTESQMLDQLLELGSQAVKDEVKLFVCQKVIHPVLQHYLRQHGVMVIERLGGTLVEPLIQLTGVKPVATLQTIIPPEAYGQVNSLSIRHFGFKRMMHLHPPENTVICTMILCHRNETMLSELKVVCQKAEHVLRLTLREPSALLGGGCTETHLAAHIRNQGINKVAEAALMLGCSEREYLLGMEAFCCSLDSVAQSLEHNGGNSLIDLTHGHHWTIPADVTQAQWEQVMGSCGCGLVEKRPDKEWTYLNTKYSEFSPAPLSRNTNLQPRVLDSFTAKLNALQIAVETANLVLNVRFIIQDVN
ncbi:McKusick-Kaufman/Bardet-Biedl syndromes putative chaperonin [Lampris incognitus]|uniref:McKusick-Kaufman/Bardet-Biedl syndromes putative chaperonin n=1 Tax=Lampris incognitus TaxID=2546036 RepID=UPI0024B61852|nr:McKusick-Kaufman/Bardet-Biedl syndromes putative chaperonin [Lampris incognitus]